MCSRSCTRVFSEPTYGLKVSFVYVYKTRLLLYKATTLHYERSQKEVMLLDIQGCGSCLFDPEIASKQLDPKNMLFCTGNLSHNAIQNFTASHKCNDDCNLLKLTPFE